MATDNFWGKFRRWRRHRPFWGGLFLILSAVELFFSANMSLGGMEVHLGPQGFLSYVIPLILLICGLLVWFTPAQRLFYGIVALLAALYSFVGLNLGGFGIGMVLGILGGGLVISWGPPRNRPGVQGAGAPPTGEPGDHDNDPPDGDDHPTAARDVDQTQHIPIAGHDDRPFEQPVRPATQDAGIVPGFPHAAAPRSGLERLGKNPKALVIALIPVAVTATILAAGSSMPANAEECPEGLPSRSTSATTSATAAAAAAEKTTAAAATSSSKTASSSSKEAAATASASGSASASASDSSDSSSNPIVEGIEDFIDGVGNLLGINGEESSSPSASPSPSETASESPSASAEPTATATATGSEDAEPTKSTTTTTAESSTTAAAEPSASGSEIPCLGARVYGLVASADDIPFVSAKPGLMEVDSLTMYNSTYDGVVDMPVVGGGSFKALKFSMDKAVNKPFSLTIDEAGDATTVITSDELTTTGTVKFYTPSFKGNLFGLIPVTFTPDQPPPLTLPVLWFTNVEIQLAYVRSDVLTGDPLKVAEKF